MNILLGFLGIILCFLAVVLIEKFFKKEGLIVWVSIATIIANILVCKTVNILGFVSSLGNIMFASNFLATDIICEKYGKEYSKKAVMLGLFSTIVFIVSTQFGMLFIPDETDIVQESMKNLFSINLRTSIASITMYFVSNMLDIWLFEKIKEKVPEKLWLRNNVATIVANCSENFFFAFLAFVGIMDISTIISIAVTGSIIEIIIALCDTPFVYLAKYGKNIEIEKRLP